MALVRGFANPGSSRFFQYAEFPGWEWATETQLANLDLLVRDQLEPARIALGVPVHIQSWLRTAGNTPSIHPSGAAFDAVAGSPPSLAATWDLWTWLARNARVGELIYEQPKTGQTGHVHGTLPGHGGNQQTMYQRADGVLVQLDPFSLTASGEGAPGGAQNPILLPGIDVVAARSSRGWPWLVAAVVAAVLLRRTR